MPNPHPSSRPDAAPDVAWGTAAEIAATVTDGEMTATAVVDQHGRVYGVEGLRVVDISIMPTIVGRGPAATAVMIAERVAALHETEARSAHTEVDST